jgi:predicted kinase
MAVSKNWRKMMTVNELVKWLQEEFPRLVWDMQRCSHHYISEHGMFGSGVHINPFHMEGNVWTHALMVMLQVRDRNVNEAVRLACLGHDLGKPKAAYTVHDKKRVRFSGHEGFSVFLAEGVLRKLQPARVEKRHVLEIINWHGNLFKEVNAENQMLNDSIVKEYALQPEQQIMDLLDLMTCDGNGRFGEPQREHDYKAEFLNQFQYAKEWLEKVPREETDREITLLIGPPCVGKSTWVEKNVTDQIVISRDATVMALSAKYMNYDQAWDTVDQKEVDRVIQGQFNEAKKQHKENIVIDMTNMSKKSRRKWLHLPKNWKKTARVFCTTMDELDYRNRQRPGKMIPENAMHRMISGFHAPLYSEFDEIEWVFT